MADRVIQAVRDFPRARLNGPPQILNPTLKAEIIFDPLARSIIQDMRPMRDHDLSRSTQYQRISDDALKGNTYGDNFINRNSDLIVRDGNPNAMSLDYAKNILNICARNGIDKHIQRLDHMESNGFPPENAANYCATYLASNVDAIVKAFQMVKDHYNTHNNLARIANITHKEIYDHPHDIKQKVAILTQTCCALDAANAAIARYNATPPQALSRRTRPSSRPSLSKPGSRRV